MKLRSTVLSALAGLVAVTCLGVLSAPVGVAAAPADVATVEHGDPRGDVEGDGGFTKAERRTTDLRHVAFTVNRDEARFRAVMKLRDLRRHAGDKQFFDVVFMEAGEDWQTGTTLRFRRGSDKVEAFYQDDAGFHSSRCRAADVPRRWAKDVVAVRAPLSCVDSPDRASLSYASVVNNYPSEGVVKVLQDDARFKPVRMVPTA